MAKESTINKISRQNAFVDDDTKIADFLLSTNKEMYDYVRLHQSSDFALFYKLLSHSDLPNFGKSSNHNRLDKNFLYYISTEDMVKLEEQTGRHFQTAKQSNINLRKDFYAKIGLPNPRKEEYKVNDYMNVLLVNSSMTYFNSKYTRQIFEKTHRFPTWINDDIDVNLKEGPFTPIDLHVAVHGIGMKIDEEFTKLRHHMFKSDALILLAELRPNSDEKNNLFIILEKNPIFFSLLGMTNENYLNYMKAIVNKRNLSASNKENAINKDISEEDEVTRAKQSVWRDMLAKEMMGYLDSEDEVFCPFTFITAKFKELSPLFIASHIKGFSDPNTTNEEKYDINNGLLLCANADALFDKHLITVSEDKQLEFSFLLDNDAKLKSQLLLMQPIFKPILNDKRMKYLAYHRKVFEMMEEERKHKA